MAEHIFAIEVIIDDSTPSRMALCKHLDKIEKVLWHVLHKQANEEAVIAELLGSYALEAQIDRASETLAALGREIARARDLIKIAKGERR